MQSSTCTLETADGVSLHTYRWLPDGAPRASVQIVHGWAEHAARYARLAEALCESGLAVYAHDLRGHGHTARSEAELGFFAERDGWERCVDDLSCIHQHIAAAQPGLPHLLLAHSLGSFMAQHFISEHGDRFAGVALSGTSGRPPAIARPGVLLARFERFRAGPHGKSKILHKMFFEDQNRLFAPARTSFDWLSRDAAEVDKYIADPLCGFPSQVQAYLDVLHGLFEIARPARQARIPKTLPLYIFHGSRDPVAANVRQLLTAYRAAGLQNVSYKAYADARHETLNETNRAEVTRDLITWFEGVLKESSRLTVNCRGR
ncbi:MAG TPA: alpha/beta hydrolase [Pirellulales bacterium]|nr:alpha/beta hydrolase [Pirellulales bacterium]